MNKTDEIPTFKFAQTPVDFKPRTIKELILKQQKPANGTSQHISQSAQNVQNIQNNKPVTFAELLAKKPLADEKPKQDALHGTGITKKIILKSLKDNVASFETTQVMPDVRDAIARVIGNIFEDMANALQARWDLLFNVPIEEDNSAILNIPIVTLATSDPLDTLVLDEYQQKALEGLRHERYGCLVGAAGTGKTTVTRKLVKILEETTPTIDLNRAKPYALDKNTEPEYNVAIAFCSFTGRAVQQLKRALPKKYHPMCSTIHALLGYMPERVPYKLDNGYWKEKLIFRPTFNASNKLPYKVIVIDEGGMCPIPLFNEIVEATHSDTRIIIIGDINQLPPVQGRSVLGFAMLKWPTFTLEKIHRQAADNPIIADAHRILVGQMPQPDKKKVMARIINNGSSHAHEEVLNVIKYMHKNNAFDPINDAIIVPQNSGTLGQIHFNEKLVHYFNPPKFDEFKNPINKRTVITAGYLHLPFALGDKVMLLQNDRERGLTNGMCGVITQITLNGAFIGEKSSHNTASFAVSNVEADFTDLADEIEKLAPSEEKKSEEDDEDESQRQASHITQVTFADGQIVPFQTAGQYKKITHAYAFTCHKSQGGEYNTVIIVVHSANIKMLTREWLYTAFTRARERVVLLYNNRGLAQAINIQRIKGKTVKEKAESFNALLDKADVSLPNLANPTKV